MKKKIEFAGRVIGFILIFAVCYYAYCRLITPKFFTDIDWPTTTTCAGFYDLEKDSADVIFLGSSHGVTSFVPQEIYNQYGITSYNLSTDEQGVVTSYYWLKEALRYQSPKAVVLECYFCFPYYVDEPLNSDETATRKAFDFMRWSTVKAEAVKTICELDENQDVWSYYLPHLRYHERWLWEGFDRNDYTYRTMTNHSELKGYSPLRFYLGEKGEGFEPHDMTTDVGCAEMAPVMQEYLDKINHLCKEKEIPLILTITPAVSANIEMCKAVQTYANENGCYFISFNEQNVYRQMDYQMDMDNCDDGHPNIWGAVKISGYMGEVLSEQFGIAGKTEPQWEATRDDYDFVMDYCTLNHTWEIEQFFSLINHEQYTVVLASKDEFTGSLRESTVEVLRQFGLSADLIGQDGCNYLAVISDGQVLSEQLSFDRVEYRGALCNGYVPLYALSTRDEWGNGLTSIRIGEEECSKNQSGLNVVVYNNQTGKIVDSAWFNTYEPENSMGR
ncbi:MAG: hypothetical protein K2N43_00260 [Lachnospiraceae bacterium]|nr:hypothetical protein [Lachnospiraceae bacterium]